ncbi:MAG TPA: VWA domain-containing protein [Polyangia bacterium]|jgi:Ca-activated chloride channel family protein
MHSLPFHDPRLLWLLVLVPLPAVWTFVHRRRRAALRFPTTHVLARGGRGWRARLLWLPPVVQMAAIALAVLALARPQLPAATARHRQEVEGIDLAIALDLSTSMESTDLGPRSRLHVAKEVLTSFLGRRTSDRAALVVFAGQAYTQVPLTLDYDVLKNVVAQLRTRRIEDGTAIGDAVGTALNRLRDSSAKSRAVVLITDGENNAGRLSPLDAAKLARELHVPVFTILIGKGGAAPMPVGRDAFGETVYQNVEMPVNPALLQSIAETTGGRFYRATDQAALAAGLNGVLDRMQRTKLADGGATSQPTEAFAGLLGGALALAAADFVLRSSLLKVSP